jgi:VCBS repeat-containing protein
VSIHGNERDSATDVVTVNSIDGDPKSVKVSVMGHASVIVSVVDIIDLLKRVAAHTNGVPNL